MAGLSERCYTIMGFRKWYSADDGDKYLTYAAHLIAHSFTVNGLVKIRHRAPVHPQHLSLTSNATKRNFTDTIPDYGIAVTRTERGTVTAEVPNPVTLNRVI